MASKGRKAENYSPMPTGPMVRANRCASTLADEQKGDVLVQKWVKSYRDGFWGGRDP